MDPIPKIVDFGISTPIIDNQEPLKLACSHFLESITTGTTPKTNVDKGIEILSILEAAEKSLKASGKVINLTGSYQ